MPDYDGRGNPDADSGSWALWIPRVILSPFYFVNEYMLRRPLGWFVTKAEHDHWADTVAEVFTFGPKNNHVIYPTALFDFGMLPSVGVYYAGENVLVDGNTLQFHAATWGTPWISATAADHFAVDKRNSVQLRFDFRRAEDNIYFGIGPDARSSAQSRFGLEKAEGALSYHRKIENRESHVWMWGGIHRLTPVGGTCCGDPSVRDRIMDGELMAPPGFEETYTAGFAGIDVVLDTRESRPMPGTGVYARGYMQPSRDFHSDRTWAVYGGVVGGAVDLTGNQRVVRTQIAVTMLDQVTGDKPVPFTEYPTLDADLMPGFVPGWLRGTSTAAAQIAYSWPVWIGFDGQTRLTLGNAYGNQLSGLSVAKLRWSWDIGLSTNTHHDQAFEILFGLGSEKFDQGAGITSVRFAIGSRQGF